MTRRGQLVLLAAVALALALVPMALAHLQLGYHEDVRSVSVDNSPLTDTERTLHRALDDAATGVQSRHDWTDRTTAIETVRTRLRSTLESLNTSRVTAGLVTLVSYNHTRAADWAASNCPRGKDRQFGSCAADRGVVVQERLGETHVLAAAFDVRITADRSDWQTVTVVRTGGSRDR